MGRRAGRTLAAASLVVLVVGCGAPGSSMSPAPVTSPSPVVDPTASPVASAATSPAHSQVAVVSPNPDPCTRIPFDGPWTPAPLLPGSAVQVSVAELNVRMGPCTSAARVATLNNGQVLVVSEQAYGPVKADGYAWYQVAIVPNAPAFGSLPALPLHPFADGIDSAGGWIAAGDGATPFVTPMAPRCPTKVNLQNLRGMLPAELLACFDEPFTLEGTFGCGGCGGSGGPITEPGWLATGFETMNLRTRWDMNERPVSIYFPDGNPPEEGSMIRATVHVDDPAAQGCTVEWRLEEPVFVVPAEIAVPYCRERMVVDSYQILGTDPDYPG